jgi:hypothetical protein
MVFTVGSFVEYIDRRENKWRIGIIEEIRSDILENGEKIFFLIPLDLEYDEPFMFSLEDIAPVGTHTNLTKM